MTPELQKKIDRAIKLLKAAEKKAAEVGQPVEICYSGGKDSDVILELAKMAEINYRAIYKNTTIDPPGTIKHALDVGAEIARPKMSFREVIEKKGIPTRFQRTCCEKLKEYKILDYAVVGVRKEESHQRAKRYQEPEICRVYNKNEKARLYLPLLDWTATDIADFVEERGIKCHQLYYDEQGNFHPERRLGCMGCPLIYKTTRIQDFMEHKGLIKLYIRSANKFLQDHPNSAIAKVNKDAYSWFVSQLFCDSIKEFNQRFGPTLFDDGIDCKKFLEDYFHIKLQSV